jgi:site-specific recombinase XerD
MILSDFLNHRIAPGMGRHGVSHYRLAVRHLGEYVGHPVLLAELTDDLMFGLRDHLIACGLAETTARRLLSSVRWLWKRAAEEGHAPTKPGRWTYWRHNRLAKPRIKRRLRRVAAMVAAGQTIKQACEAMNIPYGTVLSNRYQNPKLWRQELDRAMQLLVTDVCKRAEWLTHDAREQERFLMDSGRVARWAEKKGITLPEGEGPDLLRSFIGRYVQDVDIRPSTAQQYRYAVQDFDRWHGRPVKLSDLATALVNQWLSARLASGMSRATIKNRRGAVVVLWRAACELKLVPEPLAKIKIVRVPVPIPECWSEEEMAALLAAADTLTGTFRTIDIERAALIRAAVLVLWDTAVRPVDLLELTSGQINDVGRFVIRQHKSNWPHLCQLRPETIDAIRATFPPDREKLFPINRKTLYWYIHRLMKVAGLGRGSVKWIRRTSATALECSHPGSAMAHLGHKTPGLAYKHYIDAARIQNDKPMPPPLVPPSRPAIVSMRQARRTNGGAA